MEDSIEQLMTEMPCYATRDLMNDVLIYKVIAEFSAKDPAYNKLKDQCFYSMKPWNTMLFYLHKNPSKAGILSGSETLKKLIDFKKRFNLDYANESAQEWAFFTLFDKSYASKVKNNILSRKYSELVQDITYQITPYVPRVVVGKYWFELMKGDTNEARKTLAAGLQTGVPMGFDLISKVQ